MILRISILFLIACDGFGQSGQFIMNEIDQTMLNDDLLSTRYESIGGSPYLNDEFFPGQIKFGNRESVDYDQMRIDLVSQGIQIKIDDQVTEYDIRLAKSLTLSSGNDGESVDFLIIENVGTPSLFRIVFDNEIQLLSLVSVVKRISESTQTGYSSKSQQDRFVRSETYFLRSENNMIEVKLNKKSILGELKQSSEVNDFIKTNKINFKDEEDVVVFLGFYYKNKQTL